MTSLKNLYEKSFSNTVVWNAIERTILQYALQLTYQKLTEITMSRIQTFLSIYKWICFKPLSRACGAAFEEAVFFKFGRKAIKLFSAHLEVAIVLVIEEIILRRSRRRAEFSSLNKLSLSRRETPWLHEKRASQCSRRHNPQRNLTAVVQKLYRLLVHYSPPDRGYVEFDHFYRLIGGITWIVSSWWIVSIAKYSQHRMEVRASVEV